jgi:hypothetical protein
MDYYQKYQKYRFKYLNLLNQSGGVTPEEFKQMLENKKDDDFLDDDDIDFLTHDKIKVKDAILIDMQVCDINSIFECISKKYNNNNIKEAINPLTNKPYSLENLIDIRNKLIINKLDNDEKKKIINNLILLVIPLNIKNELLRLRPEKFEIFFTKNKIKSFKLEKIYFEALVNYLLSPSKIIIDENNNITEEFKNNLDIRLSYYFYGKNYLLLILVPEDNMTDDICKIAVQSNGLALQYIPDNKITDEIIILAVRQNSYAFLHLPKDKKTSEICKQIIRENPKQLLRIIGRDSEISRELYIEICTNAVNDNIKVIEYVESWKMTDEQYFEICKIVIPKSGIYFIPDFEITFEICKLAVEHNGYALKYAPIKNLTPEQYYEICKLAVITNSIALQFVVYDKDKLDHNQYIEICKLAVETNGIALQFVKRLSYKLEPEQYFEIFQLALQNLDNKSNSNVEIYIPLVIAVQIDGNLLLYVKQLFHKLTYNQWYKICEKAVEHNVRALEHVPIEKMEPEQYFEICKLAVKKNGIALQFVKYDKLDYEIGKLALQNLDNLSNSNEEIYKTSLVAVQIDGTLLDDVNKLISKFTYEQYNKICEKALEKNREAEKYIISEKDYNNLLSLSNHQSPDQSGGANKSYRYSYNYDEFFKIMKKESEDLEMFNLYKMILNKIINEYNKNNKIDEFEAILYGALATGQDPSKVPILFEILKISILDKDKQTILLSYNKKDRIKMLNKYNNKDVLTQIEQKIKYFYDLYKKEEAYIQQRIFKLDSKYRNKLLKFDNHEKIKYIIKNLIDNKIKELFNNANLNNLYSLNLYALMDYLDKYIKKSSRIKKSCFVKKSSKNQIKKSCKKSN